MVIPLGILAASDSARAGRHGWQAIFIALIVLAPIAEWIYPLASYVQVLFFPPCDSANYLACQPFSFMQPQMVTHLSWAVACLPIPIAALVYSLLSVQHPAGQATSEAGRGERRALIVCAIVGIVVMSVLGYMANAPVEPIQEGSPESVVKLVQLHALIFAVWLVLAALPVARTSMALAHAARVGRRRWLAGWIPLVALALLTGGIGFDLVIFGQQMNAFVHAAIGGSINQVTAMIHAVSSVAPAVVMLVALIYAVVVMRPGPNVARFAAA